MFLSSPSFKCLQPLTQKLLSWCHQAGLTKWSEFLSFSLGHSKPSAPWYTPLQQGVLQWGMSDVKPLLKTSTICASWVGSPMRRNFLPLMQSWNFFIASGPQKQLWEAVAGKGRCKAGTVNQALCSRYKTWSLLRQTLLKRVGKYLCTQRSQLPTQKCFICYF